MLSSTNNIEEGLIEKFQENCVRSSFHSNNCPVSEGVAQLNQHNKSFLVTLSSVTQRVPTGKSKTFFLTISISLYFVFQIIHTI